MSEKRYTSGELAAAAGLTIRAVQHYDNIGLLPSLGRTEGGRRCYTQDDLIRIEQIVFYKSLGFSLAQIKEHLLLQPYKNGLLEMFKNQRLLLLQKMEHLHTSFATIGIMSDMIEAGKEPPFPVLLRFLSALPGDDIFSQAPRMMTEEQHKRLSEHFEDIEPIQMFYHKWKEILIEAILLHHDGTSPDSINAQDMAKRWWKTLQAFTGGNMELLRQLSELQLENQMPAKNDEMMATASRFLENAFEIYAAQNDLHLNTAEAAGQEGKSNDTNSGPDKEIRG